MGDHGHESSKSEKEIWESLPNLVGTEKGRALYDLSNCAFENGNFLRSLTFAESARDTFLEIDDKEGLANSYASVAYSHNSLKQMSLAIEQMSLAVKSCEEGELPYVWDFRRRLATWLQNEERYEESLIEIEACLEHELYEGCEVQAGFDLSAYAHGLCELNRCEEAIEKYRKGRELFKKNTEVFRVAEDDYFIGRCFNHLKNGFEAEFFILKALDAFECAGHLNRKAQALSQLGRALIHQNRFQEALVHLEESRSIVQSLGVPVNLRAVFVIQRNMIRALKALGQDTSVLERRNSVLNETLGIPEEDK
jgi:tetratricopeptide (TPR) repeat protein